MRNYKPTAFTVTTQIIPNWTEIIKWCFPELTSDDEVNKFVDGLFSDNEIRLDVKESLYGKRFQFFETHDCLSGLHTTWSNYYKNFSDKICSTVFQEGEGSKRSLIFEFPNNKISSCMNITPYFLEFSDNEFSEHILIEMPCLELYLFFKDIETNIGYGSDLIVKKFPHNIEEILKERSISYYSQKFLQEDSKNSIYGDINKSSWLKENNAELSTQLTGTHAFKSKYGIWDINYKFFTPDS